MAKTYRIKNGFHEKLEALRIQIIIETKADVTEVEHITCFAFKAFRQNNYRRYKKI